MHTINKAQRYMTLFGDAAILLALLVAGAPASAAPITWGNSAADFNANSSWVDGAAPGSADTAVFTGTPSAQPQLTASTAVGAVSLQSGGWNLGGPGYVLTLNGVAGTGLTNASGNNLIGANLALGGDQTWAVANAADTLSVSGTLSGASSLTVRGPGTLALLSSLATPSSNSFGGAGKTLAIDPGSRVQFFTSYSNSMLGATNLSISLGDGAMLWARTNSTLFQSFDTYNPMTVGAAGSILKSDFGYGHSGSIMFCGWWRINGRISGGKLIVQTGGTGKGVALMNTANNYSGGTEVQSNALLVAKSGTLGTGTVTFWNGSVYGNFYDLASTHTNPVILAGGTITFGRDSGNVRGRESIQFGPLTVSATSTTIRTSGYNNSGTAMSGDLTFLGASTIGGNLSLAALGDIANLSRATIFTGGVTTVSSSLAISNNLVGPPVRFVNGLSFGTNALTLGGTSTGGVIIAGAMAGTGALTLAAARIELGASADNTSMTGPVTVGTNAVLVIRGSKNLHKNATLSLLGTGGSCARVNLETNLVVGSLYLDGVHKPSGTYGSTASPAQHQNDNYFQGTGMLVIRSQGMVFTVL
jgi:hypothetical protein